MNDETWLPIPGYDGAYEISDRGRVRSWIGWKGRSVRKEPRLLGQWVNSAGYLTVQLRGESSHRMVHHLTALTFIGPRPEGLFVCHQDGDKLNNAASNLRYATPRENQLDSVRHGTHSNQRRARCRRGHQLTDDNVIKRPPSRRRYCRTCTEAAGQSRAA